MLHTMQALRVLIRRVPMSVFRIPESAERSLEQHRAIRAAIADGHGARSEMRAHLVSVESDVRRVLSRAGDG
jgi:DNA-binding FadR family transcriptional regulator